MAERTVTIAEAAELLGITQKAVARRIERGTLPAVLGHDRLRRIPLAAIDQARAGVVSPPPPAGQPVGQPPRQAGAAGQPTVHELVELFQRVEQLATENGRLRALTEVSESTTAAIEAELHEARARVLELEAVERELREQLPRRRWWRRGKSPNGAGGEG